MSHVIEIEHLTKSYGKHRGVIDLSFAVEEGDIFGFLGPNGAGKSTTIRSMLGLIHYEAGAIRIFGMDAKTEREKILREIGYMPSEAMFYPSMKVSDVIRLAADMRRKDCGEEAKKLCERLQVDTNKRIEELSLGNRKKVSIVCAMQHQPKLFVFDEPTSGLDPLMQAEFFALIEEYGKKGATCLLSTHVLSEVKKYCKNVAIMKEGRLQCIDSVENLTNTNAKHVRVVKDGVAEEFVWKGDLNKLFQNLSGHDISDILIEEPSLDEIFMHYYEKNKEDQPEILEGMKGGEK
ncbi:MAG: ABC transporter ATP-binding protein [Lachnospiraceae bacterium]|nr:ABC transporter ATP-binding protein [Lachnospiraceae bacterium]